MKAFSMTTRSYEQTKMSDPAMQADRHVKIQNLERPHLSSLFTQLFRLLNKGFPDKILALTLQRHGELITCL